MGGSGVSWLELLLLSDRKGFRGSAGSYSYLLLGTGATLERLRFLSRLLFPGQSHVCLTTEQTLCVVGWWSPSFMSWESMALSGNLNYTEESGKRRICYLEAWGNFYAFLAVKGVKCLPLVVVICCGLKIPSWLFLVIYVLHGKRKYRLENDLFPPFTVVACVSSPWAKMTFKTIDWIDATYCLLVFVSIH